MTFAVCTYRNGQGYRVRPVVVEWPCDEIAVSRIAGPYRTRAAADAALERYIRRLEASLIANSRIDSPWFIDIKSREGLI